MLVPLMLLFIVVPLSSLVAPPFFVRLAAIVYHLYVPFFVHFPLTVSQAVSFAGDHAALAAHFP